MCKQADKKAALACMAAFANTDFRDDMTKVSVPTLVIHGDSDATFPMQARAKGLTMPLLVVRFT
jgi:non-heme chloroperoxidase